MNKSYDQSFILLKLKKLQDLQMEFKMDLEKKITRQWKIKRKALS